MWLPTETIKSVDRVARVYYIDSTMTQKWNASRRDGELRLLTGWCWEARQGGLYYQGFKTMTVAYRDAYYNLVAKRAIPPYQRLRLVRSA